MLVVSLFGNRRMLWAGQIVVKGSELRQMLDKIIERIKQKDKDSYFEDDSCKELAIIKYFYFWKLNWCGCGMPNNAIMTVSKFLHCMGEKELDDRKNALNAAFGVKNVYDNELLLCLAYTMDAAGLTEHGTSILWAWLTQDGEDFLYAIDEAVKNNTLDI